MNDNDPKKVDDNVRKSAMSMLLGSRQPNVSSSFDETDVDEPLKETRGSKNLTTFDMLEKVLEKKQAHEDVDKDTRQKVIEQCCDFSLFDSLFG